METLLPFLEVSGPDAQQFRVQLTKDRMTIGRFELFNDVSLEPDPQQLITRKVHCSIERDAEGWWVVDNGSINRTFVRQGIVMEVVEGRALLKEGDGILILGKLTETGDPLYWELVLCDPLGTRPARHTLLTPYLEYDWLRAKLFRIDGSSRYEIHNLRPQEHKLIRYMDQRNRANGNVPVLCTFQELMTVVWEEEPKHIPIGADLNHLIWELRKKLEPNPREPRFLESTRGLGYSLNTRSLKI